MNREVTHVSKQTPSKMTIAAHEVLFSVQQKNYDVCMQSFEQ
jgi:hypothetical protein